MMTTVLAIVAAAAVADAGAAAEIPDATEAKVRESGWLRSGG